MHLIATQCGSWGSCINCDTLLTAKAKFGLVVERYCREPALLRYSVGSLIVEPSNLLNVDDADIGEEISFTSNILVFDSRS
jgi:hypothetical protein